jgi:hypothetical protein
MSNLPSQVPTPTTTPASGSLIYIVDTPYTSAADDATTLGNAVTKAHGLSSGTVTVSSGGVMQTGQTATNSLFLQTPQAITVTSNAGTADANHGVQTFTNSSAATMTITLALSGSADGQTKIVRIYDFSAVAQTIAWVNTENSTVIAPTTSNGSTSSPLTVGFIYNNITNKWRCVASA